MEMIDEKGYDKKTLNNVGYRIGLIVIIIAQAILTILICRNTELSFLSLVPILVTLGLVFIYIESDAFCLFNYEEFHYYEIDVIHKNIRRHIHAKWSDIKYIELSGGRHSNTARIIYKKSLNAEVSIENSYLCLFRKYFKKYSKRDDIMLTVLERYKKRKPFEKDWR